jgi:hypothetical protein
MKAGIEFSKTNLKEEYKEGIAFPLQKAVSAIFANM